LPGRPYRQFGRGRRRQRLAQVADDLVDARHRIGVSRAQVGLDPHVGADDQLVAHMVEDDQVIGEKQHRVGHGEVGARRGRQPFHEAHQVIAEVAYHPAGETGQTRRRHGMAVRHQLLDHGQRITLTCFEHRAARAADGHLVAAGGHGHRRVDTDKTVAPQLLPLFHRFQQETGAFAVGTPLPAELEIDRHRRLQVRRQFAEDRNQVALCGKRAHFFE